MTGWFFFKNQDFVEDFSLSSLSGKENEGCGTAGLNKNQVKWKVPNDQEDLHKQRSKAKGQIVIIKLKVEKEPVSIFWYRKEIEVFDRENLL